MQIEEQKGDFAQTVFYAERLLEADPKNAFALDALASETARHTREFDLDKEEKLTKVDKWAKAAHRRRSHRSQAERHYPGRAMGRREEEHAGRGVCCYGYGRFSAQEIRRVHHGL